jgi:hypothetical protein
MRQTPAQLLDSWETFRGQPMPVRAAALTALAAKQRLAEVMRWSIARRDRTLFEFRARLFGEEIEAVTSCPDCGERLEMQIALADIAPPAKSDARRSSFLTLRIDGARIRCREPNSEDLLAISSSDDLEAARAQLIARCVESEDAEVRERAAALLTAAAHDIQLDLTCPACAHAWKSPFDIAAFVWRELDEWAQRTLHEIHVIAGAYGWSEDDILRLSARRRQVYVELIG